MTTDQCENGLVDAHGKPITRPPTKTERVRAFSRKGWTIFIAVAGGLALVGGVFANIDKILTALPGSDDQAAPVETRNFGSPIASTDEDYSQSHVLAFQTLDNNFGYAGKVVESWPKDSVHAVLASSSETLEEALESKCEIVHLSIGFDEKFLWFSESDVVTTSRFKDMLVSSGHVRLLVLDGCGSFAIGKVLEEAAISHLVVALPDSPDANTFFQSFYSHLANGLSPPEAVDRAKALVRLRNGEASDYSCTTYF